MPYQENSDSFVNCQERAKGQLEQKMPFVLYRKPGSEKGSLLLQNSRHLFESTNFEESGFVFSPFQENLPTVLLQPDEQLFWTGPDFKEEVLRQQEVLEETTAVRDAHLNLVRSGIQEIKKNQLEKVVLSRYIDCENVKSPFDLFFGLIKRYSNAFCYLWYHPEIGTWLGATPETLLRYQDGLIYTMALAGTQAYQEGVSPNWEAKEQKEQEYVSSYIRNRLEKECSQLTIDENQSIRAGNMWHLRTLMEGRIDVSKLPSLIRVLHPTPAVCGLPLAASKAFIKKAEKYSRAYYTGFLGELNFGKKYTTELYVNLRCMELNANTARLFVGGGITLNSDPQKEWEETKLKSRTMLNVLKSP